MFSNLALIFVYYQHFARGIKLISPCCCRRAMIGDVRIYLFTPNFKSSLNVNR